jgi:cytochrome P450
VRAPACARPRCVVTDDDRDATRDRRMKAPLRVVRDRVWPRRARPPGPRGVGIAAQRAIRRDPLGYFQSLSRRHGGLIRVPLGPIRYFAVAEPALIEQVLVRDAHRYEKGMSIRRARVVLGEGLLTSEGELHRRHARLIAPVFSHRRIDKYQQAMRTVAEETARSWRDGACVNVGVAMTRLTLRIVAATLFGGAMTIQEADTVGSSLTVVLEDVEWFVTHPLGRLRARIPTRRVRRFRQARGVIEAAVQRLIDARRVHPAGPDLLSHLAAARNTDAGLSAALQRDELVTLLISGHETTASWLAFTWLALAEHPDVEARLHEELDRELGHRPITLRDAARLPYLRAVLDESLRLYPPAWAIERRAMRPVDLGGCDIPPGSTLSLCQFAMHRDPRFWAAPERFDPDRWLDGRAAALPRGAFFPFADGPRRCIGEHFARAEAMTVIATLARRWQLRRASTEPVTLAAKITLRPRGELRMRTEARAVNAAAAGSDADRRCA